MAANYDTTEFVDTDVAPRKPGPGTSPGLPGSLGLPTRAPTLEDTTRRVTEAQQKLAELKQAQEALERDRAALEETRRRQHEFTRGRQEMVQHLTRGVGLLEKAEFEARRDAEQMRQTLEEFRAALARLEAIEDERWSAENFNTELTRALTCIENARMEWNAARLKFRLLEDQRTATPGAPPAAAPAALLAERSLLEWSKLGLALTWPLALVALLALGLMLFLALR